MGCPVCLSSDTSEFVCMEDVPVVCNNLYKDRRAALEAPLSKIRLAFCKNCGHTFNTAFDETEIDYGESYETSLHYSEHFQSYSASLANRLIDTYELREKNIIEIGCGQAEFLSEICRLGHNKGFGFDQSFDPTRFEPSGDLQVLPQNYGSRFGNLHADLLCCRHVLEHIANPISFINELKGTLSKNRDAILYFEVPNSLFTLRDLGIWDLIYEHCSYFWSGSLALVFQQCGFEIIRMATTYDEQFLSIDLKLADQTSARQFGLRSLDENLSDVASYASTFAKNYLEKRDHWQRVRKELAQNGRNAVIWGAGSKGVTFLNLTQNGEADERLDFAIDISPRKHGKYIPGTGQKIVPPSELPAINPDTVFLMNAAYESEVGAQLSELGIDAGLEIV